MFSVAAFHLVIMFLSLSKEENKKMSRWITSDDLTTTLTFSLLCVWLLCISEWYRMNFVQYFSHIKQTNNQKCVEWCWKSVHARFCHLSSSAWYFNIVFFTLLRSLCLSCLFVELSLFSTPYSLQKSFSF